MRLVLDRIEENANGIRIAVFECGEENILIKESDMPDNLMDNLFPGIIMEAVLQGEKIVTAELLTEETNKKRSDMRSRLDALKKRNKR